MLFLKGMNIIYIVIWVGLLIHWWKKRAFYPLISTHVWTKLFWGITFLFFNPVLSLLYCIFGIRFRPEKASPRHLKRSRITAFGLTAITILFFELPLGHQDTGIRVLKKDTKPASSGLSAKATTCESSNNISAISSKSSSGNDRLDIRRIVILSESDHPLMVKTGHLIQQSLLSLPTVEEVGVYPQGTSPEKGLQAPELYMTIRMPDFKKIPFPGGRQVKASVVCNLSKLGENTSSYSSRTMDPPLVNFSITINLEHKSRTMGFESATAKYDDEARNIADGITGHVVPALLKMKEEHGSMPDLPPGFYGPYTPAPVMPFDQSLTIFRKLDTFGLMTHNETTWIYDEPRPDEDAYEEISNTLKEKGWEQRSHDSLCLNMKRNEERLLIFRRKKERTIHCGIVNKETEESSLRQPMVAHYSKTFTKDEISTALQSVLDSDSVSLDFLFMFSDLFRRCGTESVQERYKDFIQTATPHSLTSSLELARFWKSEQATNKAFAMLDLARAYQYVTQSHDPLSDEIKKLAKELGDETHAKALPSAANLEAAGLLPTSSMATDITRTIVLDEPFGFYEFMETPESVICKADLRTYAVKVVADPSGEPERSIPLNDRRRHWKLLLFEKKQNMSSRQTSGGRLDNGLWSAETEHWMGTGNTTHRIKIGVVQTGDRQFRLTAEIQ